MDNKLLERANDLREKISKVERRITYLEGHDCFRLSPATFGKLEGLDDLVEESMRRVGLKMYKEELRLLEKEFNDL